MPGTVDIRPIRADEGLRLKALRLQALADAPLAFGSTLAREQDFTDSVWHERAAAAAAGLDRATFIAERDSAWLGMATVLLTDPADPARQTPLLVGMYVDAAARASGVGAALVAHAKAWTLARGPDRLTLWAVAGNAPAFALYRRCGFRPTGAARPLAHTPSLTELEMAVDLR